MIRLDGATLTPQDLWAVAGGAGVTLDPAARDRMARARQRLELAVAKGTQIYGVTTGLGPKVVQDLSPAEIQAFSLATVRGRAHAVGAPLPPDVVRAAMAIRVNTLATGAAGASVALADHIAACLNADLLPEIGGATSTGPADLMWGGSFGLAMLGEGRFLNQPPNQNQNLFAQHNIPHLRLGIRDGLALVSHSSFTQAFAALGLTRLDRMLDAATQAAALSLEAFRANLTPFRADVLRLGGQSGAGQVAQTLRDLLTGSNLHDPAQARRLQDPLSLRNFPQIYGAAWAALDQLRGAVTQAINHSSDSPVVLPDTSETGDTGETGEAGNTSDIVSSGNFLNPHLAITLSAANHAMAHLAASIHARISRQIAARFTGLSNGLNDAAAGNAGFGPLTKTTEALSAEIAHLAQTPPIYPSNSADGLEDVISFGALPGRAMSKIAGHLAHLIAAEMIVAAQAIDQRNLGANLPPRLRPIYAQTRHHSPALTQDRSLAPDLQTLAETLLRSPADL